jgi:hypothetical protein
MSEQLDSIEELEEVKRVLGEHYSEFKLSEKPACDWKRKILLAKILVLQQEGLSYTQISEKLDIARCQVHDILAVYYRVVDQSGVLEPVWFSLLYRLMKEKPEVAFNALTALKLKRMGLNTPTEIGEIKVSWPVNEQNNGVNNQLSAQTGPAIGSPEPCTVPNVALRKTLGQNDVGRKRSNQINPI